MSNPYLAAIVVASSIDSKDSPSASILQVLPSQKGALFDNLQPQRNIESAFWSNENFIGLNSVPTCDESQNGCFLESPQEHQK